MKLNCRGREIVFPRRPLVMGIVNINDDSLSGDGTLDAHKALGKATELANAGADVIDVGAESARTNREAIPWEEEVARLRPFLDGFRAAVANAEAIDDDQLSPPLLSVNAWRKEVVQEVLPMGIDILNDIGGLGEPVFAEWCEAREVALVIMHTVGTPKTNHTRKVWDDIMAELDRFFEEKVKAATAAGLASNRIILDPGIEFAKQCDDNLTIYRELERLQKFERPILLPVSRKKVIGEVLGIDDPAERDAGTIACLAAGMRRGASIFRVHNVDAAFKAVKVLEAVK